MGISFEQHFPTDWQETSQLKRKMKATDSSRERLIQAAGRLFSERGFDGVSVRDITNEANANSALVGYYFGGKEGLLAEVYVRHCEPLKAERERLLKEYSANGRKPTLEEVLDAFIRPSLEANQTSDDKPNFSRLRAILSVENSSLLEKMVAQNFDKSSKMFVAALCECLPDVPRERVLWCFHFLLGAIYYTAAGPHRIKTLSKGKCDPSDPKETRKELIKFAAAGFRNVAEQKAAEKPGRNLVSSKGSKTKLR